MFLCGLLHTYFQGFFVLYCENFISFCIRPIFHCITIAQFILLLSSYKMFSTSWSLCIALLTLLCVCVGSVFPGLCVCLCGERWGGGGVVETW